MKTRIKFILHYFLLNKYSYLIAIVLIFCVNWLQVEIPHYIKGAIDLLGQQGAEVHAEIQKDVFFVIGFSLLMICIRIVSRMYALNPGRIVEASLKNDLFYRLNRLPDHVHRQYPSGQLISIINNDLNGIRAFYGVGFLQVTNITFALSLTPIWMWRLSPELTLYSIIPMVFAFLVFREGFIRLRRYNHQRLLRLQDLSEQLVNYLAGMDLIKNQGMSSWVQAEIDRVNQELLDVIMKATRIASFVLPILDYGNQLMRLVILGLGGYMVIQQQMSLGEITAFLAYSALLSFPLMQLGRFAVVYQMGMVSIDSVQSVLNNEIPQIDQQEGHDKKPSFNPEFSVKGLNYTYADQSQPTLKDIHFEIAPGKKVGILGSIGSGKSTLVNCINHHLEIPEGVIFWGEEDIAQMPRPQWRKIIRTITQEPYLFSDTVEANIRFGSDDLVIDQTDIDHVLELSQLQEDVSRFPQGKQTIVGEKGIMLSGGQKQRLSIARALLTPCDLLVMDNVLSAVDYETERKILSGLFKQIEHQSVLVVSHRISAFENLDEILVLDSGKIIARGSHEELLASSEYYLKTWQLQQSKSEVGA